MMGFFKTMFASAIGFMIAIFLLFGIMIIAIVSSSGEPEPYIRNNSILHIELSGTLPERPSDNPFDQLFSPGRVQMSLAGLKENLRKAAADDRVSGIWLEVEMLGASWPVLEDLREHLLRFRESGKFIYASTRDMGMNEQALFIATAADSVFAMNETMVLNSGFFVQGTFFASMFEKFGIDAEVVSGGDFKTAADNFVRTDFSHNDRIQLSAMLDAFSTTYTTALSEFSGRSVDEVNAIMNRPPLLTSRYAVEDGFIHGLAFPNEVEDKIRRRLGIDENRDLELVSYDRYSKVTRRSAGLERRAPRDRIAVINATGLIMPGVESAFPGGGSPMITAVNFAESLDEALNDDNVKAIVIRINSPGGSGITSDLIWQHIRKASEKKPVIASMGGVATSGGYYIAMAADTIVASPTTVTGSIGVISAMLNFGRLMEERLGITFDEVKTHQHADWFSVTRSFTPAEYEALERFNSEFYDSFTRRVAESRTMPLDDVLAVAEGRIWSGSDALEAGLVDVLGGLDTALEIAAGKAGIEQFSVVNFPRPKSLMELFSGSAQTQVRAMARSMVPFAADPALDHLELLHLMQRPHVLAIMPYYIEVR